MLYNKRRLIKLHKRKYTRRKPLPMIVSSDEIRNRLLEVKKMYDKNGSLEAVAKRLNITRERVRQLLKKGHKYKLFNYETHNVKHFNELIERISKEDLINAIKLDPNRFSVCESLNIKLVDYFKLVKFYQIDTNDYVTDARYKKYLIRYSNIVDEIGHHPVTTELKSRSNWRSTWAGITRIWGSFENFRREFGIVRPPYSFNQNQIEGFKRARERRRIEKKVKIEKVKNIIGKLGPVSRAIIEKESGYSNASLHDYLIKLQRFGVIKKVDGGRETKYKIKL